MGQVVKSKLVIFWMIVLAVLALVGTTTHLIAPKIKLGLDLQGGFEVLYQLEPEPGKTIDADTMAAALKVLSKRADASGLGVTEPEFTPEYDTKRIRVALAGVPDQARAQEMLGKTAAMTFRAQDGTVLVKGSDIKGAKLDADNMNRTVVNISFKDAQFFEKVSRQYLGQLMCTYMDERQMSCATITSVIPNGEAVLTVGGATAKETKALATEARDLINSGAMPAKLTPIYSNSVNASLGEDALYQSLWAGAYAVIAIFIFMIGYYRVPGFVAVIALIAYAYLVLVVFWVLGVHLTLAGIAAYILGIGIAVDANIIMSERVREEMRLGKTIALSVRAGSKRSFLTIFDAHITTLIAGGALFFLGESAVRGFAVSLITGILVSFLTAVALSRYLMTLLVRSRVLRKPTSFGVRADEIHPL